jgi:glycosyltransferase involved in cell wall biosynthesis
MAEIHALARAGAFPLDRLTVASVPHGEVPGYLSAADLAFAPIRTAPSRRFCSPVKVGEYWATGLPIVITEGVGDDSDLVRREHAGVVIDVLEPSLAPAVEQMRALLAEPGVRERMATLAERWRSRSRVRRAYDQLGLL